MSDIMKSKDHSTEFNPVRTGGLLPPPRVFAKYLKNGLPNPHQLYDFKESYKGHLVKLKAWGYVIYCCHGNQLAGTVLG